MPALNEEQNIANAITAAQQSLLESAITDYEILVVTCPDRRGYRDRTADIVRERIKEIPQLRLIDSEKYRGLGENYRRAVNEAKKEFIILIPGDNENERTSIPLLLSHIGRADMILSYTINPEVRPWSRRALSWIYTKTLNILFHQSLKYYNGINIYRTDYLRLALPLTQSFAYSAEIVINQLRDRRSYIEIPVRVQARPGASKALGWRSFRDVTMAIFRLWKRGA